MDNIQTGDKQTQREPILQHDVLVGSAIHVFNSSLHYLPITLTAAVKAVKLPEVIHL